MDRTVAAAARAGIALGAHPGYYDLRGFGRRPMAIAPAEVETDVLYQVGALQAFARSHGARVVHVKPHGALYNQAAEDERLARAVARGTARGRTYLFGPRPPDHARAARRRPRFAAEAFATAPTRTTGRAAAQRGAVTRPARRRPEAVASPAAESPSASGAVRVAARPRLHVDTPPLANARAVREPCRPPG